MARKPPKKKAAAKNQAVARRSNEQALTAPSKVTASMLQQDAGAGQENMSQDDLAIPRLAILQQLSPQCQKNASEYIEDAEPGYLLNSVTEDMYSGEEGLKILKTFRKGEIHLLIADMMMPAMTGRELKDQADRIQPDLKVLFVSGYADDQMMDRDTSATKVNFLQKPFGSEALLLKVREILDKK